MSQEEIALEALKPSPAGRHQPPSLAKEATWHLETMMAGIVPGDLMHEDQVYERYPGLFAERELREARKAGRIPWYDLRKGPHFTDDQIMEYLQSQERALWQANAKLDPTRESPAVSSNIKASGSPSSPTASIASIGTSRARGTHGDAQNGKPRNEGPRGRQAETHRGGAGNAA
jgi:hypothetical protein